MNALVLTPEQCEFVRSHEVEVLADGQGKTLGYFMPLACDKGNGFTREEIDEAIRESENDPSPGCSIEDIRWMFAALERHADANPGVDIWEAVRATGLPSGEVFRALALMGGPDRGKPTAEVLAHLNALGAGTCDSQSPGRTSPKAD